MRNYLSRSIFQALRGCLSSLGECWDAERRDAERRGLLAISISHLHWHSSAPERSSATRSCHLLNIARLLHHQHALSHLRGSSYIKKNDFISAQRSLRSRKDGFLERASLICLPCKHIWLILSCLAARDLLTSLPAWRICRTRALTDSLFTFLFPPPQAQPLMRQDR